VQQKVIKILRIGKNETGTKIFAKRVQHHLFKFFVEVLFGRTGSRFNRAFIKN
jgi:hypothetical protein